MNHIQRHLAMVCAGVVASGRLARPIRGVMIIVIVATSFLSESARAGDLNPPPGPIRATMKPLSDIEPRVPVNAENTPGDADAVFVIRSPGSYYLTGNLAGEPGKHGIAIDAGQVALDLAGFDLVGGGGTVSAIHVRQPAADVVIVGGAVCGWELIGVDTSFAASSVVSDVQVSKCGSGIVCGDRSRVQRCIASDNASGGILTGRSCRVSECSVSASGHYGMYVLEASQVSQCVSESNGDHGLYLDGDGCHVADCTFTGNGLNGVASIYSASIERSTAEHNASSGFWSLGAVTFTDCRASFNSLDGIQAGSGSTVTRCAARENGRDGLVLAGDASALDNHVVGQREGAGLRVTGSRCRVEGNTATSNADGFVLSGRGNLLIRNTASGNTHAAFDVGLGNAYGPIVNAAGAGDLSTVTGAQHPWANFNY